MVIYRFRMSLAAFFFLYINKYIFFSEATLVKRTIANGPIRWPISDNTHANDLINHNYTTIFGGLTWTNSIRHKLWSLCFSFAGLWCESIVEHSPLLLIVLPAECQLNAHSGVLGASVCVCVCVISITKAIIPVSTGQSRPIRWSTTKNGFSLRLLLYTTYMYIHLYEVVGLGCRCRSITIYCTHSVLFSWIYWPMTVSKNNRLFVFGCRYLYILLRPLRIAVE